MPTLIALDLETTGINKDEDLVIEVAAVKFDPHAGGKIIDTFDQLINPGVPIPAIVTQITGITDDHVASAPDLESIKERLIEFVGDAPIVGHFINFDIDFLATKGIKFTNPQYDTFYLTGIFFPGLPSYSLETITQLFDLDHHNAHRALDDSIASMHLFNLLTDKIKEIPTEILSKIQSLLKKSTWVMKPLFETPFHSSPIHSTAPPRLTCKTSASLLPPPAETGLPCTKSTINTSKKITALAAPHLPPKAYYLPTYHHQILESPITPAELLATLESTSPQTQTVFATPRHAINSLRPNPEITTIIHPPSSYLSPRKLEEFESKNSFTDPETILLTKIHLWLPTTQTGLRDEIKIYGEENETWLEISCVPQIGANPKDPNKTEDFFQKAYKKVQEAKIIVISHALLTQSLEADIIPNFPNLIITQAHKFEREATFAAAKFFTFDTFERILESLPSNQELEALKPHLAILFGLVSIFFKKTAQHQSYEKRVIIDETYETNQEWIQITEAIRNFITKATNLNSEKLTPFINALETIITQTTSPDHIVWIYKYEDSLGFKSTQINICEQVAQEIFPKKSSVLIHGSALSVNGSFAFIRHQLHLDDSFESTIQPQTTSEKQISLEIISSLPSPTNKNFPDRCDEFVANFIREHRGHTFIIYSSRKSVETLFHALAPSLKQEGITLLAQSLTGSQGKIIEKFKTHPETSVIIGNIGFWQQISQSNLPFKNLLVQKIPFDVISDPIIKAQSAKYQDSFTDFSLPRATIQLKDTINSFLSSPCDQKSIYLLDSRLTQNSYGQTILNSLPVSNSLPEA